ncbi:MAG: hemolysin family protein [Bacteroidota bacterium]
MLELFIIFLFILLNGFFVLSEIALITSKKSRLQELASKGNHGAQITLKLLERPEIFLSTIQVGITLISIVSGAYGGTIFAKYLIPELSNHMSIQSAETTSLLISIFGITYFSIILGELLPKTIALNKPEKIALVVAPILNIFTYIILPIVKVLTFSTKILQKILFIKPSNRNSITEEELKTMIQVAQHEGVLDIEETEMHNKLFNFNDKRSQHFMTHRTDVEWIDIHDSYDSIKEIIKDSSHNIFPACDGSIDEILGTIHNKDFFELCNLDDKSIDLQSIINPPIFVPENLPAIKLIKVFKEKKEYFGFVIDEYGTFQGIVTLHDLAEGILGDLPTDDIDDEPDILVRDDLSLLVDGFTTINDINEQLKEELISEDEDFTTVAGFIMNELDAIPRTGDKFNYQNYSFEIVDMDGNKIDKVIITALDPQEPMEDSGV